jgi:hypothetical protein
MFFSVDFLDLFRIRLKFKTRSILAVFYVSTFKPEAK